MIERVWAGARRAKHLRTVIVATDDERIAAVCRGFGAEVAMTRSDHPTGTDRIAEVARGLEDDIVVNIQGDEPLIEGFVIDACVEALEADPEAPMATGVHALDPADAADPNRVKVVLDRRDRALYFSRSPIPFAREAPEAPMWQHIGLYAYRRPFLATIAGLAPTPAERTEQLEQLRVLEHGYPIRCAIIQGWHSVPVDVPADIAQVEARLHEDRT